MNTEFCQIIYIYKIFLLNYSTVKRSINVYILAEYFGA